VSSLASHHSVGIEDEGLYSDSSDDESDSEE